MMCILALLHNACYSTLHPIALISTNMPEQVYYPGAACRQMHYAAAAARRTADTTPGRLRFSARRGRVSRARPTSGACRPRRPLSRRRTLGPRARGLQAAGSPRAAGSPGSLGSSDSCPGGSCLDSWRTPDSCCTPGRRRTGSTRGSLGSRRSPRAGSPGSPGTRRSRAAGSPPRAAGAPGRRHAGPGRRPCPDRRGPGRSWTTWEPVSAGEPPRGAGRAWSPPTCPRSCVPCTGQ
mmetsp:Transcript_29857/g.79405  ORF Transcript_29857/g.79405 Transcript_29857/m.79405 type:complete len:236 (-) Transcript_29857:192-899(-)